MLEKISFLLQGPPEVRPKGEPKGTDRREPTEGRLGPAGNDKLFYHFPD